MNIVAHYRKLWIVRYLVLIAVAVIVSRGVFKIWMNFSDVLLKKLADLLLIFHRNEKRRLVIPINYLDVIIVANV